MGRTKSRIHSNRKQLWHLRALCFMEGRGERAWCSTGGDLKGQPPWHCPPVSANRLVDQTSTAGHADLVNICLWCTPGPVRSARIEAKSHPPLWLFRQFHKTCAVHWGPLLKAVYSSSFAGRCRGTCQSFCLCYLKFPLHFFNFARVIRFWQRQYVQYVCYSAVAPWSAEWPGVSREPTTTHF